MTRRIIRTKNNDLLVFYFWKIQVALVRVRKTFTAITVRVNA